MNDIIKIQTAIPKSTIDEFRQKYGIPNTFTDERIYEVVIGNLVDRFFLDEKHTPEDVQNLLTDNVDEQWL